MRLKTSNVLADVYEPPVSQTKSWIADRTFDADCPLIDVSQAVPGYPPAQELRDMIAALAQRESSSLYAPSLGLAPTREAVIRDFRNAFDEGVAIAPDHVLMSTGCNQAFCLAIGAPWRSWFATPVPSHTIFLAIQPGTKR